MHQQSIGPLLFSHVKINMDEIEEFESLPDEYSFPTHLFAGAMAGIAEHAILFPMDSIKVDSLSIMDNYYSFNYGFHIFIFYY